MKRARINPRNDKRAKLMRERNFPDRPIVPPSCFIAHELRRYQARHGEKMVPMGWSRCWGPVDFAHVVHARGMGGANSDKTQGVYMCRGHHDEQEGKTAAFEALYRVDLKAEAARIAAGATEPGPPA